MPTAAVWCVPYFGTVGFYKRSKRKSETQVSIC